MIKMYKFKNNKFNRVAAGEINKLRLFIKIEGLNKLKETFN